MAFKFFCGVGLRPASAIRISHMQFLSGCYGQSKELVGFHGSAAAARSTNDSALYNIAKL